MSVSRIEAVESGGSSDPSTRSSRESGPDRTSRQNDVISRPGDKPSSNGEPDFDETVDSHVSDLIEKAKAGLPGASTKEVLARALELSVLERDTKNSSNNVIFRNAEYFLYCMDAALQNDVVRETMCVGSPVYDAVKLVAFGLKRIGLPKLEWSLRANKANAVSFPGTGSLHAYRGLMKGLSHFELPNKPSSSEGHNPLKLP